MAYRITRRDRSLQTALRRIACEQIDAALAELTAPDADPNVAIHQTRKHFKKLRGLLRLVRPGFDGYARENAVIRDLAVKMSGPRDTGVLIETHDKLMIDVSDPARFAPLRAHLLAQAAKGAEADSPLPADLCADLCEALQALRERSADWRLRGKDRAILRAGLTLTWTRAATGYRAARKDPSVGAMHEWRKRVKYNWYHSRLLRDINARRMQPHRDAAKQLAGVLGDHHDIAVYLDRLDHLARAVPPAVVAGLIADLKSHAIDRKAVLETRAFALGKTMLYKKPGKLPKRWTRWWRNWRKG
ncbi:CHAD domain-containing protein [Antarcticimicrobium sediminis]|uniref:CHAD domain-containing protein n=1 Tax=Antarcticimicrobium sediminis TaxID=2546227 RepID=A0A4R5EQ90_9RHOB|nr:CHAD domain-containing protein [Antarcticimicrobium sediminis]TDE36703.1 CHAD domain-containing protein [Antarcticimicrobium sediminis]